MGGGAMARREIWESSEVTSGRFPVLFKGGGRRVRLRFHLFVSDANQRDEGGCVQDILA